MRKSGCLILHDLTSLENSDFPWQHFHNGKSPSPDYFWALIFSSPEPLGSQGELIVYPSSRRPSVRRRRPSASSVVHNAQRSSSPKPLGKSKPNFMWSLLG